MRDYQRSKVYAAESCLPNGEDWRKDRNMERLQAYCDKLCDSAWFKRRWGTGPGGKPWRFTLKDGRGARIARGGSFRLKLPRWSRTEATVLHEMAHTLCHFRQKQCSHCGHVTRTSHTMVAAHGRHFAKTMLELVEHQMGKETADLLRKSYRAEKVRLRGTDADWYRSRQKRRQRRKAIARGEITKGEVPPQLAAAKRERGDG